MRLKAVVVVAALAATLVAALVVERRTRPALVEDSEP
jgi:hypothetical protein